MDKEEVKSKIEELGPWYHNINLDGLETKVISHVPEASGASLNHPASRWRVIRKFLPENGNSVVNLGCNAGGISFKLEESGYKVTGIELNDKPYKQALFAKEVLDSEVNFVQADATEFLKSSQVFDYAVALGLVYHLKNPERFIELLGEKTRKRFVIESSWYRNVNGKKWIEEDNVWHFSRDWLKEKVKKTGISKIFTAVKGEKDLPIRGFRFLIVGRFKR